MASPNEDFLEEMLDDLFATLEQDTDVVALGWGPSSTKRFKLYDGRVLPVLSDGTIDATALPALYVPSLVPELGRGREDAGLRGHRDRARARRRLSEHDGAQGPFGIGRNGRNDDSRGRDKRTGPDSLEGSSSAHVDEFETELGELNPVRSEENPRAVPLLGRSGRRSTPPPTQPSGAIGERRWASSQKTVFTGSEASPTGRRSRRLGSTSRSRSTAIPWDGTPRSKPSTRSTEAAAPCTARRTPSTPSRRASATSYSRSRPGRSSTTSSIGTRTTPRASFLSRPGGATRSRPARSRDRGATASSSTRSRSRSTERAEAPPSRRSSRDGSTGGATSRPARRRRPRPSRLFSRGTRPAF